MLDPDDHFEVDAGRLPTPSRVVTIPDIKLHTVTGMPARDDSANADGRVEREGVDLDDERGAKKGELAYVSHELAARPLVVVGSA